MRHESASNAAEESTKECWSIGPEEVHSRQPCGRPDAKPDCKEQGYRNGMSHVETLAGAPPVTRSARLPRRGLISRVMPSAPLRASSRVAKGGSHKAGFPQLGQV